MWQLALIMCVFITIWILLFVYGWNKTIKSMDKEVDIFVNRAEHKRKTEQMAKNHEEASKRFDKEWSKLGR